MNTSDLADLMIMAIMISQQLPLGDNHCTCGSLSTAVNKFLAQPSLLCVHATKATEITKSFWLVCTTQSIMIMIIIIILNLTIIFIRIFILIFIFIFIFIFIVITIIIIIIIIIILTIIIIIIIITTFIVIVAVLPTCNYFYSCLPLSHGTTRSWSALMVPGMGLPCDIKLDEDFRKL